MSTSSKKRATFHSRLGFILVSAGCAVGLGNVWKFPYICGENGGGAFLLIYLLCLLLLGLPIVICEFAIGRGSRRSISQALNILEQPGSRWHITKYAGIAGNYLLMMFYTTIAGWMILYFVKMATGQFDGLNSEQAGEAFGSMLGQPVLMTLFMAIAVFLCFAICAKGLQKGVERITKVMMVCLLSLMIVLAVRSVLLPGGQEGLKFYLYPDFSKVKEAGIGEVVYAAMGQAFFTLSIGIGALAIFGSYIGKEHALMGEAVSICVLDTFVALMSGLIIFPSCFAYNVQPDSGPSLIFITLPNVFNAMAGGRLWGTLFFLFMTFASLSTVIAVFENIISFTMDLKGWSRKKAVLINLVGVLVLSMPCVLGYNVWSGITPLGAGSTILDLEDFIVSNNLLPLGSLVYLLFCTTKLGWGYENFLKETNTGKGMKFPGQIAFYVKYILPLIVLFIFVMGYYTKFFA